LIIITQISGKIEEWQENLNGNFNVILAGHKPVFVKQDKNWLRQKYPVGSSVVVFYQNGALTSMRGTAEESATPPAKPATQDTAEAPKESPPVLGIFDGISNGQIRVISDGQKTAEKYSADLDLLKMLASSRSPARPGDHVGLTYVETKAGKVIKSFGLDRPAGGTVTKPPINPGVNDTAERAKVAGFETGNDVKKEQQVQEPEFIPLDLNISPAELAQLAVDDPPKFHRLNTFRLAFMASQKAMFTEILQGTGREGIPAILEWLDKETDFYTAPSSTKFHEAREGGLLYHSLKMFEHLKELATIFMGEWPPVESLAIIALLHDVCKTNFYRLEIKAIPRRDEEGKLILFDGKKIWDETPVYSVEDEIPLGHGEKSVILLLHHGLKLTDDEIMAIRWHMMAFDDIRYSYNGNVAITKASGENPLIVLTHMADLSASFLDVR
jgi:hypothetical protein